MRRPRRTGSEVNTSDRLETVFGNVFLSYSWAKQGFSSRTSALLERAGCDLLTSVAVFPTGTQPVVVASPVVHHAAHSEYLCEAAGSPPCIPPPSSLLSVSGSGPDIRDGPQHVHSPDLDDGAPDSAAQPPLDRQQRDSQ